MKEYKLSAKSKYSVLYLLCGLFMFFFMFAIFSLSSHASAVSDYVLNINSSNGTFFDTSGLYHSFSSTLQHPEYAYPITTVSGSSSFTRPSNVESVNLEVHVVTSKGDFVVDTHQGTGSYEAFSSVKLEGYPIGYYGVCKGYLKEGTSSTTMTMNVSCSATVSNQTTNVTNSLSTIQSNTNQILALVGGQTDVDLLSDFSDYSSYSPVNSVNALNNSSFFPTYSFPAGSPIALSFPDFSYSRIAFCCDYIYFINDTPTDYVYSISYNVPAGYTPSFSNLHLDIRKGSTTFLDVTDFKTIFTGGKNNYYSYTTYCTFHLEPYETNGVSLYNCFLDGNLSQNFSAISFSLNCRKLTIADYMSYVKDNYTDITPSVTDLNQNTAQSVSDISTAQTFETSAFTNFNNQFSSSGLDTFSMSFASTPLLWVSSIITTFYNNMPSTFQYLLMFVAFVGILCTVLNVFGRVAQRFGGGDNATKLNGKDVFSKIEKNGSI